MALQKPYRGLSDLVGLYEAGQIQLEVARFVQPQIDVLRFAEPPRWQKDTESVVAGGGTNYPIGPPVPEGERRLVYFMGAAAPSVLPAGRVIQMTPTILIDNGSAQYGLEENPYQYTFTSVDYVRMGKHFPNGFLLSAGDQIAWFIAQSGGATAFPMTTAYQYIRIKV